MEKHLLNNNSLINASVTLVSDADYAAVELFKDYPDGLLKFASVCCVIFMFIGIPGNLVTIVALARYKRVHNATAIFIMNLSFSDMIFCCLTPALAAATFWNRSWRYGKLLCRLYPPARYILIAVSIFTILAITMNRYIIVVHPRLYRRIYSKRNIGIMLAALWIFPLLTMIPTWLGKWGRFDLDANNGSCSIVHDKNNKSPKTFLFLASSLLPGLVIFFCYARIYLLVRKATKKTQPNANGENLTSDPSSTTDSTSITVRVTGVGSSENSEEKAKDMPMNVIKNSKFQENMTSPVDDSENTDNEMLEPPRLRRNLFKRSIALLKVSLPTRKDKRLGTMIFAIMVSFCACHFPIILTKVLSWLTQHPIINIVAHILLYLSSCINPVIYVVMSKEYRKAYNNLFNCRSRTSLLTVNARRNK